MVFSSAVFLFIFLPAVILLHTFLPDIRVKNGLLIAASLLFYSWGEPVYILLLLFSVCINYFTGRLIIRAKTAGKNARGILVADIVINLAFLVVFKYAGFIAECLNVIPFVGIPVPDVRMPVGISFYTFQAISYCVDTYKSEEKRAAGFFEVMLYICLFPQLVAGPIVKYNSIREQIHDRNVSAEGLSSGIVRFIVGLSKKMLIANQMAVAADLMFSLGQNELNIVAAWVGAACYMLQIYFDFSGYSDMAVGMGRMFGFDFPENFNYPYTAVSIRDFWKRWHISLTSWFREYLYFPLGGNRKGKNRTLFNRFFVFLCTGIWHGANLTFIFWGIYHGLLTIIETIIEDGKKSLANTLKKVSNTITDENAGTSVAKNSGLKNIIGHIYTIIAVMVGFVIFRADTMKQAVLFIKEMFSFHTLGSVLANIGNVELASGIGTTYALSVMNPMFMITFLVALVACTPVIKLIPQNKAADMGKKIAAIVLYGLCILELAAGSYNPFIYFRF